MLTSGLDTKRFIGATAVGLLLFTSCGGDDGGDAASDETGDEEEAAEATESCDLEDRTWVAFGREPEDVPEIDIYEEPDGTLQQTLPNPWKTDMEDAEHRSPTPFVLKSDDDPAGEEWLHVDLPVAPTGSSGYVRAEDVSIYCISHRITVDRENFTLTLTKGGEEVHKFDVGLGRDERATQEGHYFVTELIIPPNPEGDYGTHAYGINGFADDPDIVSDFPDSGGQVGIHGTNEPDLIPGKVSSGCIRLRNEDIAQLEAAEVPLGTPVDVI